VSTPGTCFTCQYRLGATAAGSTNIPFIAFSDYIGQYTTIQEADVGCQKYSNQTAQGKSIPCWYTPLQPHSNRFYMSLAAPSTTNSVIPIVTFACLFVVSCIGSVVCHLRTSDAGDRALRNTIHAAQERARERGVRAMRWTDYHGPDDALPASQLVSATRLRRAQGDITPAPGMALESVNIELSTMRPTFSAVNPMFQSTTPAIPSTSHR
jgi:hypothetical protein